MGAYGGRRDIMEVVSPVGQVYQAGTLSGNPVAMAAGLTQLRYLNAHPEVYTHLEALGERLYGGMEKLCQELKLPYQINHVGSLGCMFFTEQPVVDYTSAKALIQKHLPHISAICWTMAFILLLPSLKRCSCPMHIQMNRWMRHCQS